MSGGNTKSSKGDEASWRTVQDSVESYRKLADPEFTSTFFPHLQLVSASVAPKGQAGGGDHESSCTFRFTVQPEHCNRLGTLHGGAAATLFDFCTTMPLTLISRPGHWQYMGVSRSLAVTYLRPAPRGSTVLIECHVVHSGSRLCALRGVMRRADDGLVVSTCEHNKANIDPPINAKL